MKRGVVWLAVSLRVALAAWTFLVLASEASGASEGMGRIACLRVTATASHRDDAVRIGLNEREMVEKLERALRAEIPRLRISPTLPGCDSISLQVVTIKPDMGGDLEFHIAVLFVRVERQALLLSTGEETSVDVWSHSHVAWAPSLVKLVEVIEQSIQGSARTFAEAYYRAGNPIAPWQ